MLLRRVFADSLRRISSGSIGSPRTTSKLRNAMTTIRVPTNIPAGTSRPAISAGTFNPPKLEEDATGRFLGKYWGTGDRERERQSTALVVNVKSLDAYAVELTFFSDTYRNRAWPGGNQVYILSDSAVHTYRLNCRKGGKICFGVWRRGNTNSWWGVGYGGRQGCTDCCLRCGTTYSYTLNAGSNAP